MESIFNNIAVDKNLLGNFSNCQFQSFFSFFKKKSRVFVWFHCSFFSFSECLPGYFGENCSTTCLQGYYGNHCINRCECPDELCNATTGCVSEKGFILI